MKNEDKFSRKERVMIPEAKTNIRIPLVLVASHILGREYKAPRARLLPLRE
jgi:hypothetical protein